MAKIEGGTNKNQFTFIFYETLISYVEKIKGGATKYLINFIFNQTFISENTKIKSGATKITHIISHIPKIKGSTT